MESDDSYMKTSRNLALLRRPTPEFTEKAQEEMGLKKDSTQNSGITIE